MSRSEFWIKFLDLGYLSLPSLFPPAILLVEDPVILLETNEISSHHVASQCFVEVLRRYLNLVGDTAYSLGMESSGSSRKESLGKLAFCLEMPQMFYRGMKSYKIVSCTVVIPLKFCIKEWNVIVLIAPSLISLETSEYVHTGNGILHQNIPADDEN